MRNDLLSLLVMIWPTMACSSSSGFGECEGDPCCITGPLPSDNLTVQSVEPVDTETATVTLAYTRAGTCRPDTSSRLTWRDGAWTFHREPEHFAFGSDRPGGLSSAQPLAERGLTIQTSFGPPGSLQLTLTAIQGGASSSITCQVVANDVTCAP